jgi:hypothetical protein
MDGRVKPGHDDVATPNKKAGVAAGFLVIIQSAIPCLRVI